MSRSRVALEACGVTGDQWTEACACIERLDAFDDDEFECQELYMTPIEMKALYERLKLYYEQGIWSLGTVEGGAA